MSEYRLAFKKFLMEDQGLSEKEFNEEYLTPIKVNLFEAHMLAQEVDCNKLDAVWHYIEALQQRGSDSPPPVDAKRYYRMKPWMRKVQDSIDGRNK